MLDLEYLKKFDKIYIIGHQNLDVDSTISSFLLSKILTSFGINTEFAILNSNYEYVADEKDVINDYFFQKPTIIDKNETIDKNFILVDHNSPISSVVKGNIVGCIDHHGGFYDKIYNFLIGNYSSTAEYIYELYKNNYSFSEYDKLLISLTIIMDTKFLRSPRFQEKDSIILKELNSNLNIDELIKKYFRVNDFSLGIETNFNMKKKLYQREGIVIYTTYIDALKEHHHYINQYFEYLKTLPEDWILTWYEYDTSKTFCYAKINNIIKHLEYDFIASKANNIIPDIFN